MTGDSYEKFCDVIDLYLNLKDKLKILNVESIEFENLSKLGEDSAEQLLFILEKYDHARLFNVFETIELNIDCKYPASISFKCYLNETEAGFNFLIKHYESVYLGKNNAFEGETETSHYLIEECKTCRNNRKIDYDFGHKIHAENSVFGDLNPSDDVDGKGGVGYWTLAGKRAGPIWAEYTYKKHEITKEQKENMLGCLHAFEEGTPYFRNKITQKRLIHLNPYTGMAHANTWHSGRHCFFYIPMPNNPEMKDYPAMMQVLFRDMESGKDEKRIDITGTLGNIDEKYHQVLDNEQKQDDN